MTILHRNELYTRLVLHQDLTIHLTILQLSKILLLKSLTSRFFTPRCQVFWPFINWLIYSILTPKYGCPSTWPLVPSGSNSQCFFGLFNQSTKGQVDRPPMATHACQYIHQFTMTGPKTGQKVGSQTCEEWGYFSIAKLASVGQVLV